ncbi:MAG: fasciclin domain-containing protein [Parafilimonas sp.]
METLEGDGPFTVFAPTNEAFNKLPKGTVETLLKPENKQMLTSVLTYHVVAGKIDSKTLMDWIKKNNGTYTATTVQGDELTFTMSGNNIMLTDAKGNMAKITVKDVYQKNGVIHVIDTVLMPKS